MSEVVVDAFYAELEKVARYAGSTLELRPNAWELGIHAKREKKDQRGVAYAGGTGSALATGVAGGASIGAVTGGPPSMLLRKKTRDAAIEEAIKDVAKTRGSVGEATKAFSERAAKGDPEAAGKVREAIKNRDFGGAKEALKKLPHDPERIERSVEKGVRKFVSDPHVKEMALRRMKGAGKAALTGAAALGGAKLLYNVGQYESAKALTNRKGKRRK